MKTFKRRRQRSQRSQRSQRQRSQRQRSQRQRGAGYSDGPDWIKMAPGNLVHHPYTGAGKDCTGDPLSMGRPGYISNYNPYGLPGLKGGRRFRGKRLRGGAPMPFAASVDPVTNPNTGPVSGSVTPKPDYFPDTIGVGGTVAQPQVVPSWPGAPLPATLMTKGPEPPAQNETAQKGGRYGFFPELGPLNPLNGVGVYPAPFGRIPCEAGTTNPLNLNPHGIQSLTTTPSMPPYVRGGSRRRSQRRRSRRSRGGSNLALSAANFPVVRVGDSDSMRYYAPTAGYRNDFTTFQAPSAVPGLTIQTPYDARAFNQACIKTGGSRTMKKAKKAKKDKKQKKVKGGACPVAFGAAEVSQLKMGELMNRSDFDGSKGGLPVKFGGRR